MGKPERRLSVGTNRLVLKDAEELEPSEDGILTRLAIRVPMPLAGGDLGNRG